MSNGTEAWLSIVVASDMLDLLAEDVGVQVMMLTFYRDGMLDLEIACRTEDQITDVQTMIYNCLRQRDDMMDL